MTRIRQPHWDGVRKGRIGVAAQFLVIVVRGSVALQEADLIVIQHLFPKSVKKWPMANRHVNECPHLEREHGLHPIKGGRQKAKLNVAVDL